MEETINLIDDFMTEHYREERKKIIQQQLGSNTKTGNHLNSVKEHSLLLNKKMFSNEGKIGVNIFNQIT